MFEILVVLRYYFLVMLVSVEFDLNTSDPGKNRDEVQNEFSKEVEVFQCCLVVKCM